MTSNSGAKAITASGTPLGFAVGGEGGSVPFASVRRTVLAEVRRTFRPELLNRVDDVVVFQPLSEADMLKITRQMLEQTAVRAAALGLTLQSSEDSVEKLAREGFDPPMAPGLSGGPSAAEWRTPSPSSFSPALHRPGTCWSWVWRKIHLYWRQKRCKISHLKWLCHFR